MQLLHCFVVMVTVIATVTAEYDWNFCRKHLDLVASQVVSGTEIPPVFYDDMYVFMEIKNIINTSVVYVDEDYSQGSEMAFFNVRSQATQTMVWVDAKNNEIMTAPTTTTKCQDSTVIGSLFANSVGVTINGTDVMLNNPDVALGWHKKFKEDSSYLGQSSTRGLYTERMMICSYNPYTGITAVTEWHIVNPNTTILPVVMSGIKKTPVLPVKAYVWGLNKTGQNNIEFEMSIDFTFYDGIDPTGPVFKIPPDMICAAKPSYKIAMPPGPTYFQFRGEEITIENPNSQNPDPANIAYTHQKYMHGQKIFVVDYVSTPGFGSTNDKSLQRVIDDFNTGLSYKMDLISGACYGEPIDRGGIDSITITGGYVQIRNFQQFFDMDSDQFQYMGIHTMRGIDCDTWSARFNDSNPNHKQNALYTWYFANPQWLKNYKYNDWIDPLPVTLEIRENGRYTQFNLFDYDTQDNIRIPDVTLCMNTSYTYNIQLYITAPYSEVTAFTVDRAYRALFAALITQTSLKTLMRVSHFDIQPAGKETLVKFKIFDLRSLNVKGDVQDFQYGATNEQIFDELGHAVNSSTFTIDVVDPANSDVAHTFLARPYSLGLLKEIKYAGLRASPPSTSSSFSPGSMAGIGIGMLVLGLVLGLLIVFGVGKIRKMKNAPDMDMVKLDHESET